MRGPIAVIGEPSDNYRTDCHGLALLDTVPDYEPLFYDAPTAQTFVGTATGGSLDTLVDTNPGVDFTSAGPWRYIRIYDGPGAHQIGEIIGVAAASIRVGTVWKIDNAEKLEDVFVRGPGDAGVINMAGWFDGQWATGGSQYVVLSGSKEWLPDVGAAWPAVITAKELRQDAEFFGATNQAADVRISEAQSIVGPALLGSGSFQATVPALYLGNPSQPRSMFAYVPGLVNMQVWYGQLWMPRPYGPKAIGLDVFEDAVRSALGAENVTSMDNWDSYHRNFGEVHCGTNVIRVPEIDYREWWNNTP